LSCVTIISLPLPNARKTKTDYLRIHLTNQ
jgi:hypothetical protein